MHFTLISPRLAIQKGDFLGSGVPYWPLELATLAAFLQQRGDEVSVIDLFGISPARLSERSDHYLQGASIREFMGSPAVSEAQVFVLYAISFMSSAELLNIAGQLRARRPEAVITVLENAQAVTGFSLPHMAERFFVRGVDALLCGEIYGNWDDIAACLKKEGATVPCNVLVPKSAPDHTLKRLSDSLAAYPVPAWSMFSLQGYWSLPYAHGPKTGKYLPVLTSRGCPYPCDFCVIPETNARKWRSRDPDEVVSEITALRDRYGVHHFQIEDLNPTVKSDRWDEICRLLIERQAGVFFYFVSGTKAETVHLDQIPLFAKAGCRYLSISPESGSNNVLKVIGKRFDHAHALKLIASCRSHGIRTQACLLTGHPAETEEDHRMSCEYLKKMVRAGLDEVAVFVVAPFAGSALYSGRRIDMDDQDALPSFSPKGRKAYAVFTQRRSELTRIFLLEKMKKGADLWLQGLRAAFGRPQTKIENLPWRIGFVLMLILRYRVRQMLGMTKGDAGD